MENNERVMEEAEQQEDDEELEEGPPPGFHCMPSSQLLQKEESLYQYDDDDDDEVKGPPPGFSTPPALLSDVLTEANENDMDEEDGPPPGWHSVTPPQPMTPPKTPLVTAVYSDISDVKGKSTEEIEDEDEGPPPGWQLIPPEQPQHPFISESSPSSAVPSDIEMGCRHKDNGHKSKNPPFGFQSGAGQKSLSSPSPPIQPQLAAADTSDLLKPLNTLNAETESQQCGTKYGNSGTQTKRQSVTSSKPPPPQPHLSEMGQMVCGSCRQLLSYPKGAKYVQCSPCQTVNLVLEAHQVGQVKCGGCSVLIMYPYGSPSVRCSSCRFETSIGAHNRRPPLSEQQARRRTRSSRVH